MTAINLTDRLMALVHQRLAVLRQHSNGEWGIFKYSKRVFFNNLWHLDPLIEEARGIVVDLATGDVVQYPFSKVYNYTERDAGSHLKDSDLVQVVTKVNGFLGVASMRDGELLVTTSGSFESDFVALARKWLDTPEIRKMCESKPGHTFMFEICDESDPHIVYETPGAYLIGCRKNELGSPLLTEEELNDLAYGVVTRPEVRRMTVENVRKEVDSRHDIEGFMIRDNVTGETICKWKSRAYLRLKFLSRSSFFLREDFDRMKLRETLEEELYHLVDYIFDDVGVVEFKSWPTEKRVQVLRDLL